MLVIMFIKMETSSLNRVVIMTGENTNLLLTSKFFYQSQGKSNTKENQQTFGSGQNQPISGSSSGCGLFSCSIVGTGHGINS